MIQDTDFPELEYYTGRKMNPNPSNGLTLADLDVALFHDFAPVFVRLEPGDATRYEFMITPLAKILRGSAFIFGYHPTDAQYLWLIQRTPYGSDAYGKFIVADYRYALDERQLAPICQHNEWSQKLLTWWFQSFVKAKKPSCYPDRKTGYE